jgi:hypothetical protein
VRSGRARGWSTAARVAATLAVLLAGAAGSAEEAREPGIEILPIAPRGVEREAEGHGESQRERPVPPERQELPPVVPRPWFTRNRRVIPDELLRSKREGWFVTGIPIIGGDSDKGFTYGAAVQIFDNGSRDDPLFRTNPYRYKLRIVGQNTTNNRGRLTATLDAPNAGDSPWSLRAGIGFLSEPSENYFGLGEEAMSRLLPPKSARYYEYDSRQVGISGAVEYDTFGGIVRPLVGVTFSHIDVEDYQTSEGLPNKLFEDCHPASGEPILGCDGGWDNFLKLGLTWDTLDFAPDPSAGVLAQIATEWSTRALGSDYDYGRVTLSFQGYRNLAADPARVILAARFVYSMQFGNVPFFSEKQIAFNQGDHSGLGGYRTLRGFDSDRFVGRNAAFGNLELRWSIAEWTAWRQNFRPMLVPFVDGGRVFDRFENTSLRDWRFAVGGGLRVAWNLSTIIGFDYAWSPEQDAVYFRLDHPF